MVPGWGLTSKFSLEFSMRKLTLVTLIATILLAGCFPRAPQKSPVMHLTSVTPAGSHQVSADKPNKGETATASVGAPILVSGKNIVTEYVSVPSSVSLISSHQARADGTGFYRINTWVGEAQIKHKDARGFRYATVGLMNADWYEKGKFSYGYDDITGHYRISPDGRTALVWSWPYSEELNVEESDELNRIATIKTKTTPDESALRRELLYTGRNGSHLTVLYREFINDMARPAFSQQLQYDISNDPVIGYQGARFRVIEANNTNITYEVLSTMSAPR